MKKHLLLSLVLLPFAAVKGQDKLAKIAAPNSPAAYILGIQPTSVMSPKSFKALETALYSNFINSEGKTVLPTDLALEFTPYWAKDHGLSLKEVLYPAGSFDQLIRNSSFSMATSSKFLLENETATSGVGLGYRTSILFESDAGRKKLKDYTDAIAKESKVIATIVAAAVLLYDDRTTHPDFETFMAKLFTDVKPAIENTYHITVSTKQAQILNDNLLAMKPQLPDYKSDTFFPAFNDQLLTIIRKVKDKDDGSAIGQQDIVAEFNDYLTNRDGFSIDFAYSSFVNFPTNTFGYSFAPRQAFWLTPSYRMKGALELVGILRYEWYHTGYYAKYFPTAVNFRNNFDYGLAINADLKNFSIQFEAVGRSKTTEIPAGMDQDGSKLYKKASDSDFQYIGSFSYRVNKQIAFTYSLGSGFKPIVNPGETLVSLLSLNLGFGGPTKP